MCPECQQETSLVTTGTCGNCGYGYDIASARSRIRQEQSELQRAIASHRTVREQAVVASKTGGRKLMGVLLIGATIYALYLRYQASVRFNWPLFTDPSQGIVIGGMFIVGILLLLWAFVISTKHTSKARIVDEQVQELERTRSKLEANLRQTDIPS